MSPRRPKAAKPKRKTSALREAEKYAKDLERESYKMVLKIEQLEDRIRELEEAREGGHDA